MRHLLLGALHASGEFLDALLQDVGGNAFVGTRRGAFGESARSGVLAPPLVLPDWLRRGWQLGSDGHRVLVLLGGSAHPVRVVVAGGWSGGPGSFILFFLPERIARPHNFFSCPVLGGWGLSAVGTAGSGSTPGYWSPPRARQW